MRICAFRYMVQRGWNIILKIWSLQTAHSATLTTIIRTTKPTSITPYQRRLASNVFIDLVSQPNRILESFYDEVKRRKYLRRNYLIPTKNEQNILPAFNQICFPSEYSILFHSFIRTKISYIFQRFTRMRNMIFHFSRRDF